MRRESAFVVAHCKDDNDRRILYLNMERIPDNKEE